MHAEQDGHNSEKIATMTSNDEKKTEKVEVEDRSGCRSDVGDNEAADTDGDCCILLGVTITF